MLIGVVRWVIFSDVSVELAQMFTMGALLYTEGPQGSSHQFKYTQQRSLISGLCLRELGNHMYLTTCKHLTADHSDKQREGESFTP